MSDKETSCTEHRLTDEKSVRGLEYGCREQTVIVNPEQEFHRTIGTTHILQLENPLEEAVHNSYIDRWKFSSRGIL